MDDREEMPDAWHTQTTAPLRPRWQAHLYGDRTSITRRTRS
jgi:hypothetical protein